LQEEVYPVEPDEPTVHRESIAARPGVLLLMAGTTVALTALEHSY